MFENGKLAVLNEMLYRYIRLQKSNKADYSWKKDHLTNICVLKLFITAIEVIIRRGNGNVKIFSQC